MIITDVIRRKNGTQYVVCIDNIQKIVLDSSLIIEFGIKKNKIIDEVWLKKIENEINYKSAYEYSIRLLSIKDRTSDEIKSKLLQKNYGSEIIEKVLVKLIDNEYINDEKYVETWLKEKSIIPGMSKKALYYKLLRKGINKSLLDKKFNEIEIDEYSSAILAAEKKIKTIKGDNKTTRNKLYLYLKGKGYYDDICYKVISAILKNDGWE